MNYQFEIFDPTQSNVSIIPTTAGNYLIALRPFCQLPRTSMEPIISQIEYNGKMYNVIYTGISTNLQTRDYKQHFTGNNAGRSTFRKSLGCLMGFEQVPRDLKNPSNGKTKFNDTNEKELSTWMKNNLLLFYYANNNHKAIELELINEYNPPFNIKNNHHHINEEYRKILSNLRSRKSTKQEDRIKETPVTLSFQDFITPKSSLNDLCNLEKREKKGKATFTQAEKETLVTLIKKRCNAQHNEQKSIRNKMRTIGFYGKDDFGITDMTVDKFEDLIQKGLIKILE